MNDDRGLPRSLATLMRRPGQPASGSEGNATPGSEASDQRAHSGGRAPAAAKPPARQMTVPVVKPTGHSAAESAEPHQRRPEAPAKSGEAKSADDGVLSAAEAYEAAWAGKNLSYRGPGKYRIKP